MADGILDLSPKKEEPKPAPAAQTLPPAAPPPVSQPIPYEFHKREGRHWPVLLIYGLGALLLAIGFVFGGRWAYREIKNDKPAPRSQSADVNKIPATPKTTNQASGAASQAAPPPSSSPPASNQNQSSTQLPKTGDDYPGQ